MALAEWGRCGARWIAPRRVQVCNKHTDLQQTAVRTTGVVNCLRTTQAISYGLTQYDVEEVIADCGGLCECDNALPCCVPSKPLCSAVESAVGSQQ